MLQHESLSVKSKEKKDHYFQSRDFDLAEKVSRLPDSALVGAFEVAALTGIAATSIQKPSQRKSIGFPEPRVIGRLNKWPLSIVRGWLGKGDEPTVNTNLAPTHTRRPGRPTKAVQLGFARSPV
jgi:predicted DNA-binding transcriptional regulator AlpA